jgi:hypothetical protein
MMVVVMAMGQRGHYEQILGDRGASVNRYSLYAVGIALCISDDEHTTTVVDGKCLIPQRKGSFKNGLAIFAIPSIKNIHQSGYVSSLTVPEPAP